MNTNIFILLTILFCASCAKRKDFIIHNEARHPATYLKGQVQHFSLHDSTASFDLEIKSSAKYSTYGDLTVLYFALNERGDTVERLVQMFPSNHYKTIIIPPGTKCLIESSIQWPVSAKSMVIDFISGRVDFADSVNRNTPIKHKMYRN